MCVCVCVCVIFCWVQVSEGDIQRLVQSSPPLLKCQPARVAERVRCVQQLTGLTLIEVLKVLSRTFVLATTSVAQLVNRYEAWDTSHRRAAGFIMFWLYTGMQQL